MAMLPLALILLVGSALAQTPVIGGTCKLGTADVQIGGKQTQFFLKCEATADSTDGEGVWVVKSRAAASAAPAQAAQVPLSSAQVPAENTQPQQHPKSRKQSSPNICEQDNGARESETCAVSATCLQAHNEFPSSYLQCDQTTLRWTRKSCQDGFLFNFEQQTCIVPKRMSSLSRQQANGLLCTFSSCSNSNPCNVGTCNNGYCCSSSGSSNQNSAIILTPSSNNNCVGCGAASPQIITIPSSSGCPGGGYSVGTCNSGYCATGYSCVQNQCCPSYSAPQVSVYSCPSGGSAVGACISGQCATGYSCYNNACCPSTTTQNPFVCPDGTQAAGGCVNGQCGTGYTCSNGLCCVGTTTTVRCLDGSSAVGACIPSCTGNACGGVQVSYYCGTGYTCTTGNICCPVNSCPNGGTLLGPAVNGLCPNGYTLQGDVCCSSLCTDGSAGTPAINGICPGGTTLTNGVCCASTVTCDVSISNGPCTGVFNGGCSAGHACDTTQNICCPIVDFNDANDQVGPCLDGTCPALFVCVLTPNNDFIDPVTGDNPGVCVSLQSVPGVCDVADQVGVCNTDTATGTCPTGFTCFTAAGICCTDGTVFSRLRGAKRPNNRLPAYGRPLNSYMPPRIGGSSTCADGSLSAGACMNGLCGLGHVCQNGQCCNPSSSSSNGGGPDNKLQSVCPSGETAVSGCFIDGTCGVGFECVRGMNLCCPPGQPSVGPSPSNILPSQPQNIISPRPIGARCQFDGECVGQQEGLSMCHAGVCQCSPIAYSQGIACIRRKSFQMNDEPTMDGEKPGQIVKSV